MTLNPSLSCKDLSVSYGAHPALRSLTLDIPAGIIQTLIGPNGSGKSTALRVLAGLAAPTSGAATFGGRTLMQWRRAELAKHLSYLPQAPIAPTEMTVENLVRQGRFSHVGLWRRYAQRDRDAIQWALESTAMTPLAQRGLGELSGGERQRAWIAAALAQEAATLILDEPTSFLDIGHQAEVMDLLSALNRERGVTVIMAIHDINQAMMVSDRIALLDRGELKFFGDAAGLAQSGLIEATFNVAGRFVSLGDEHTPHFDVELKARRAKRTD